MKGLRSMIAFLRRLRYVGEAVPAGPGGRAALDWTIFWGYLVESSAGKESRELVTPRLPLFW